MTERIAPIRVAQGWPTNPLPNRDLEASTAPKQPTDRTASQENTDTSIPVSNGWGVIWIPWVDRFSLKSLFQLGKTIIKQEQDPKRSITKLYHELQPGGTKGIQLNDAPQKRPFGIRSIDEILNEKPPIADVSELTRLWIKSLKEIGFKAAPFRVSRQEGIPAWVEGHVIVSVSFTDPKTGSAKILLIDPSVPFPSEEGIGISYQGKRLETNGEIIAFYQVLAAKQLIAQGKTAEAKSLLTSALTINPKDPEVYNQTGVVSMSEKQWDEAIRYFKKASEVDAQFEDAYTNLAQVYFHQENLQESLRCLWQSLALNPRQVMGFVSLAQIQLRKGKPQEALAALGSAALKVKHYATLESFIPVENLLNQLSAIALLQLGKFDEAISSLLKVIQREPENFTARYNLGICYFRQAETRKDSEERRLLLQCAMTQAQQASNFAPPPEQPPIDYLIGSVYEAQGSRDEAMKYYRLAVEKGVTEASIRIGELLITEQKYSEAKQILETTMNNIPSDTPGAFRLRGLLSLARIYDLLGETESSQQAIRAANDLCQEFLRQGISSDPLCQEIERILESLQPPP